MATQISTLAATAVAAYELAMSLVNRCLAAMMSMFWSTAITISPAIGAQAILTCFQGLRAARGGVGDRPAEGALAGGVAGGPGGRLAPPRRAERRRGTGPHRA